jgi:hypothetical protein
MKKEKYSCDCGSVMVSCGGCYIQYNNGMGDGCFDVYVFESEQEFEAFKKEKNISVNDCEFVSSAYFKEAHIMSHDVPNMMSYPILKLENGRFGIECNQGDVYFIKWEEWKEFEDEEDFEEEEEE